ncbi:putative UPF0481 protein At3g02645 [Neltuma alba]|uniref:putative UPF0481 protein At3g02645 n=1 Tax=Neltuma alba TaxID=207710 RepID=UPI0010A5655A|nr:putative UPF0481 protein At3g02645 [Prosopis alba]
MASMMEQAETAMAAECCCIYRAPNDIRKLNEDSFTPKVVSIGPFHYGHPRLQNMEKYKLVYLKQLCQRISCTIEGLDRLISLVEEIEPSVRLHYSEPIELSNPELVKVILVDSCFLFELFLRSYYSEWDGIIKLKPWQATAVRIDLLLLENQLPFHDLDKLFRRVFPFSGTDNCGNPSFLHLTFNYFAYYNKVELDPQDISISHFTDLIRTFHLPSLSIQPESSPNPVTHLQSATELAEAGVTFRKSKSRSSLLDFKFSGRILEIPELTVDDGTETLLRNLVALEQCHYPSHSYITDYVAIMDFLINTSKDVDLLVQEAVIVNLLGEPKSAARLFNSLWKNVTRVNFNPHYSDICKDLNAFCKSPWNNMKATLNRDYCNTPWRSAASIAGILLLLLSLIQAVSSISQMVQQFKQSSPH